MIHPETAQILAYVADRIPFEESFELEAHFADCPECAGRAKAYRSFRYHFDQFWETWESGRHSQEFLMSRVREGSRRPELRPELGERLWTWAATLPGRIETVLKVALDSSQRTAQVLQEGAERLLCPEGGLAFSLVEESVVIHGEAVAPPYVVAEAKGPPWTRVIMDPVLRKMTVQTELKGRPWPLLVLIPEKAGGVLVSEFHQPEGEEFLLAEFRRIQTGEYIFLLEKRA